MTGGDWGEMAYIMSKEYPSERISIKGNCSEIGRCTYTRATGRRRSQADPLGDHLMYEAQWKKINFIQKGISEWIEEVKPEEVNCGYDIYDLFYWEHRMGSWQAQAQLEWDIVQETFVPFNNRELLDIMLRIDPIYRCTDNNLLYKKAMENLWPEVLSEPINPKNIKIFRKLRNMIKRILFKLTKYNKWSPNQ